VLPVLDGARGIGRVLVIAGPLHPPARLRRIGENEDATRVRGKLPPPVRERCVCEATWVCLTR
jgi:hypothetical protein